MLRGYLIIPGESITRHLCQRLCSLNNADYDLASILGQGIQWASQTDRVDYDMLTRFDTVWSEDLIDDQLYKEAFSFLLKELIDLFHQLGLYGPTQQNPKLSHFIHGDIVLEVDLLL